MGIQMKQQNQIKHNATMAKLARGLAKADYPPRLRETKC